MIDRDTLYLRFIDSNKIEKYLDNFMKKYFNIESVFETRYIYCVRNEERLDSRLREAGNGESEEWI
jgi:hypothetical protein|tara:strand:+ start:259 stop:456 length:198 start_codon:yes stop_codon:yes gene_type:complete